VSSKPKSEVPQREAGPEGLGRARSDVSDANTVPVSTSWPQPVVGAAGATRQALAAERDLTPAEAGHKALDSERSE
jgi:hypothetical protein